MPDSPTTLTPQQQTAKLAELKAKWGLLAAQVGGTFELHGGVVAQRGKENVVQKAADFLSGSPANWTYPQLGNSREVALQAQTLLDEAKKYGIDTSQVTKQGPMDNATATEALANATKMFSASAASGPTASAGVKAAAPNATIGGSAIAGFAPGILNGSGGTSAPLTSADRAYMTRLQGQNVQPDTLFGADFPDAAGNLHTNPDVPGSVNWSPYASDNLVNPPVRGGTYSPPTSYTFREALALPYSWNQDEMQATAEKLWRAGFLDVGSIDPTKPFNVQFHADAYDPKFEQAYFNLIQASWATPDKTVTAILDERAQQRAPFIQAQIQDLVNQRIKAVGMTDPARVQEQTITATEKLLGREATPEEIKAEQAKLAGTDATRISDALTGGTPQPVDVTSDVAADVRAAHPDEVYGKQATDTLGLFRELVGVQW